MKDEIEVEINGEAAQTFVANYEHGMTLEWKIDNTIYDAKVLDWVEHESSVLLKLQLRFRPEDVIKRGSHNLIPSEEKE